jgi:hypothetical protein
MNGQHLRSFPPDELTKAFDDRWKNTGILQESESGFAKVTWRPLSPLHTVAVAVLWKYRIKEFRTLVGPDSYWSL